MVTAQKKASRLKFQLSWTPGERREPLGKENAPTQDISRCEAPEILSFLIPSPASQELQRQHFIKAAVLQKGRRSH